MRRLLVIVLLALLPLQFSWAAVASYCGHETEIGAGHVGHHEHEHHGDVSGVAADASQDADADKAPGAMDLDCGHCHGHCSVMLTLSVSLPGALSTAPPRASADAAGAA
ncbi:MAG: hypothetical protein H7Z15_16585, partial [Rhizobacter sp.]|nr:hypothetical protein [Rhizobacter sp.]